MTRGIYSSLIENEAYKQAEKDWFVELSRSYMYWYDLVINPSEAGEIFNTRKLIVDYLEQLKKEVEKNLEKRFVYFICSRTKVRFNTRRKPRYNPLTKRLKIHLLIGKKERKTVKVKFYDIVTHNFFKPKVELTEKYITVTDDRGDKATSSIHDFLSGSGINLGYNTKIQYVGYTKNPHTRPTNGAHSGLNEVLYNVSNEEHDTLIFFNLFKVTTDAKNTNMMFNFVVANSMIDEIKVDLEGLLIEKCFILYFDSNNQTKNKEKEREELKNNLLKLSKENKINSIQFCYEFETLNDYWSLSSSKVKPQPRHVFTVSLDGECPNVAPGSKLFSEVVESWV